MPPLTRCRAASTLEDEATPGSLPTIEKGVGGVRSRRDWARRMRDRWQTVSCLWEENKTAANKLEPT